MGRYGGIDRTISRGAGQRRFVGFGSGLQLTHRGDPEGVTSLVAKGTAAPTFSRSGTRLVKRYVSGAFGFYEVADGVVPVGINANGDYVIASEESDSEYCLYSTDANSWAKSNCTTPSSITSPLHGINAYAVVESSDGVATIHYIASSVNALGDTNGKIVFTCAIIAAGNRDTLRYYVLLGTATALSVNVNLTNETFAPVTGVIDNSGIESLGTFGGKEYKLVWMEFTSDKGAGNSRIILYTGDYSYQGNGSTCFYLAYAGLRIYPSTKDAYLYLPFDDASGSTVSDESGNSRDQTLTGSSTNFWVAGRSGNCGYFDASVPNYISLPTAFFDGEKGTWGCWVKKDWSSALNGTSRFLCTDHSSGANYEHRTFMSSGAMLWQIYTTGDATTITLGNLASYSNQWIHISFAWQYDGSASTTIKAYLNGVQTDSKTIAGALIEPDTAFDFGKYGSNYLTGYIDDFVFYQRCLHPDDITLLYQQGALKHKGPNFTPIVTTSATVTKNADTFFYKGDDGNLGGSGSNKKGTIRLEIYPDDLTLGANLTLFSLNDGGSSSDEIRLYVDASGHVNATFTAAGGTVRIVNGPAVDVLDGASHVVQLSYSDGKAKIWVDSTAGTENTDIAAADIPDDLDRIQYGYFPIGDEKFYSSPVWRAL